jgi:hypothetical protein
MYFLALVEFFDKGNICHLIEKGHKLLLTRFALSIHIIISEIKTNLFKNNYARGN